MSFPEQDWTPLVIRKNKPQPSINVNKTSNQSKKIFDPTDPESQTEAKSIMIDKELGQLIEKHRVAKGLTQKELANALSVTVQTISDYEKGKGVRNGALISKIKRHLGINKNSS